MCGKHWHVNIAKPIIFPFFIHLISFVVAISVKFYCFYKPIVPNLKAESEVPELATRESEHLLMALIELQFSYPSDWIRMKHSPKPTIHDHNILGPLLLTWFYFSPSMDKQLHPL